MSAYGASGLTGPATGPAGPRLVEARAALAVDQRRWAALRSELDELEVDAERR